MGNDYHIVCIWASTSSPTLSFFLTPVKSPFFENLIGGSTPEQKERRVGYTLCTRVTRLLYHNLGNTCVVLRKFLTHLGHNESQSLVKLQKKFNTLSSNIFLWIAWYTEAEIQSNSGKETSFKCKFFEKQFLRILVLTNNYTKKLH